TFPHGEFKRARRTKDRDAEHITDIRSHSDSAPLKCVTQPHPYPHGMKATDHQQLADNDQHLIIKLFE
ncbi:hypothetical protein WKU75_24025, partial [Salmonella enterica]